MTSEKEQKSAEELKQRLAEIAEIKRLDSNKVKFPYYCKECNAEFWMNALDILRLTDQHLMPCGHEWAYLDFKKTLWEQYKLNNPLPEVNNDQSH